MTRLIYSHHHGKIIVINMNLTIPEKAVEELSVYLTGRKKIYEVICKKFEDKYGTLELLEKRIEEDGVPLGNHTLWDDAIEWKNAIAELNRITGILWSTQE